ncbi:hypothetical protein GCM10010363_61270 [Streptomyces omiyaensis]|uniref:ParB/RepB/Spo0J family partition protein n=1 Tax=Streptomyces omiyaensis TaxID=68247 RepID=UPI00167680A7|nr:ParB N-terminal domain-containing protein [Streptomyces omiyaensis]GGY71612.1 hypothetical protein GCM10010363_61270 [Streptomyces omiyaensis]
MAGKGIDDDFADFLGDAEAPVADTRPDGRLLKIPLQRLSPNGVNPRTDFGPPEELLDLGKSLARRQNHPCPVVSRQAYLKLWPEHAAQIGDVDYVLVSGERRFRAATEVGMLALHCVVDDGIAVDRKIFMEAVVSENVDRQNFNPIEEANAILAMVKEFGTNRAVAEHFERADGWVTQRVNLTYLCAEVQSMVRGRDIPLEDARTLGKLVKNGDVPNDFENQLAWWEARKAEKAAKAQTRKAAKEASRQPGARSAATTGPASFTAVKQKPPVEEPAGAHPEGQPVSSETENPGTSLPEQRAAVSSEGPSASEAEPAAEPETSEERSLSSGEPSAEQVNTDGEALTLPPRTSTALVRQESSGQELLQWNDGAKVMDVAVGRMDDLQFSRFAVRYLAHTRTKERLAAHLGMSTPYEHRVKIADLLAGAAELLRQPPETS